MEKLASYLGYLKHVKRIFLDGLKEATFRRGLLLTGWPAIFFSLYGFAVLFSGLAVIRNITVVLSFVSILPIILILYEALFLSAAIALLVFTENRKFAVGLLYGEVLTFVVIVALATLFSLAGIFQAIVT